MYRKIINIINNIVYKIQRKSIKMKASELIKELQKQIDINGDLIVGVYTDYYTEEIRDILTDEVCNCNNFGIVENGFVLRYLK